MTDILGLLITVTVCAASAQDRDGAKGALLDLFMTTSRCRFVFADAGFAGQFVEWAQAVLHIIVESFVASRRTARGCRSYSRTPGGSDPAVEHAARRRQVGLITDHDADIGNIEDGQEILQGGQFLFRGRSRPYSDRAWSA